MLLIEFLLVICSFQVSKKKNRKLLPRLLGPWEEEEEEEESEMPLMSTTSRGKRGERKAI